MGGLTRRAEQALLGALLSGGRLTDGFGCLRPGDFALERHRRVYVAIASAGLSWDGLSLGRRETVELAAASRTSPRYLGDLRAACPDPSHAPAYAALVLEARVCRTVSMYAAAFSVEASLLRGEVGRLARASGFGIHPADRYASQMKLIAADMRSFSAWFNPGKTLAVPRPPMTPGDGRARDEEMVLAVLIQQRPEAGQLMRMLHATVFTDPLREEVFLAIASLHVARQPIDELTVDWELVRLLASVGVKPTNVGPAKGQLSYVTRLAAVDFGREETARVVGALGERMAGTLTGLRPLQDSSLPRPPELDAASHVGTPVSRL